MRVRLPSPAMVVAAVALVLSMTGLADAAKHAVSAFIAGHRVTAKPAPGAVLLLGRNGKFPASAIPTVKNAARVNGQTAEQLAGSCPPAGWCR